MNSRPPPAAQLIRVHGPGERSPDVMSLGMCPRPRADTRFKTQDSRVTKMLAICVLTLSSAVSRL